MTPSQTTRARTRTSAATRRGISRGFPPLPPGRRGSGSGREPEVRTEQEAATKALAHAGTPTRTYLDALGRAFIDVGGQRAGCAGQTADGT